MPELPDVAGFKRYLDATSLHQRIESTECRDDRIVENTSRRGLQQRLKGTSLEQSRRWGKWLFMQLGSGGHLVLHFGMTGQLSYAEDAEHLPEHARFVLHFANGSRLAVISQRMIGQVSFADDIKEFAEAHDLGPDALDVEAEMFCDRLGGRRGAIKSALMNQSIVAGVGNVYSDEILFQVGLHPARSVHELDEATLREIHQVMRRVLRVAAEKGGDIGKLPRGWLLPRRGEDNDCPRCGGKLKSTTISGRTAWFCPRRQPSGQW